MDEKTSFAVYEEHNGKIVKLIYVSDSFERLKKYINTLEISDIETKNTSTNNN